MMTVIKTLNGLSIRGIFKILDMYCVSVTKRIMHLFVDFPLRSI